VIKSAKGTIPSKTKRTLGKAIQQPTRKTNKAGMNSAERAIRAEEDREESAPNKRGRSARKKKELQRGAQQDNN